MADDGLALLNLYEFEMDGAPRHVVAFLDVVLAGAQGIDVPSIVGDFNPGPDGGFDAQTFRLNPEFVRILIAYMNEVTASTPEIRAQAAEAPGEWIYLIDPRYEPGEGDEEPPAAEIVGSFAVDERGQVAPGQFQYNRNHRMFDAEAGVSGILRDRRFYDWLHPKPVRRPGRPE